MRVPNRGYLCAITVMGLIGNVCAYAQPATVAPAPGVVPAPSPPHVGGPTPPSVPGTTPVPSGLAGDQEDAINRAIEGLTTDRRALLRREMSLLRYGAADAIAIQPGTAAAIPTIHAIDRAAQDPAVALRTFRRLSAICRASAGRVEGTVLTIGTCGRVAVVALNGTSPSITKWLSW